MFSGILYYDDPYKKTWDTVVLSCERQKDGRARAVLDRIGFYPGGGGQPADTGTVNGIRAEGCSEDDPTVLLDTYIEPGTKVQCSVDLDRRLGFMRRHTGEHIVSGLLYRITGGSNVGFHMNESLVTLDWSLPLEEEMLERVEREANAAVMANLPVSAQVYPSAPAEIFYRAKKELEGEVRLVTVQDIDTCACCGLHVRYTGEVGMIRIVDAMHWKGGSRVTVLFGLEALADARTVAAQNREIAQMVSAKPYETAEGVRTALTAAEALKLKNTELKKKLNALRAESLDAAPGALTLFKDGMTPEELRHFALTLSARRPETVAVFSGSDAEGYRYCIARQGGDVRTLTKAFNAALSGRGGGSAVLTQGSVPAARADIEKALEPLLQA